jgi:hypothetical protein
MRWVYPRLPADGRGKLDLGLAWRGALQSYTITNADITMAGSRTTGKFGITLGDTITIRDTDLRFTGVDTRTLEQLIPGFKSPRRGVAAGHAIVSGGRHALQVNGDVTFDDARAGTSRVVANGLVGFLDGGGVQARDLRLQLRPLQVDMARTWKPDLPIGGILTGTATVNGNTTSQLAVVLNVEHTDRGARSALEGHAAVKLAGTNSFDVDVVAQPVSLVTVGRFFPAAGLHGSAIGPIHLAGTLGNLRVNTDLRLPDGGRFDARGALDLASRDKGYDLTAHLYTLNLRTITTKGPVTSLTAAAEVHGRGTQLATMNTTVAADLSASRWDTLAVDTVSVHATLAKGLAQIQHLYARGYDVAADVSGNFGLTRTTSGELTYKVAIDSLGALNRWLPKANANAKPTVQPRPRAAAQALARAREDSARIARASEMQRLLTGAPGPRLSVPVARQPVRTDTLSGSLIAAGTLRGNIYDFDLRGRAAGEKVVARGNFVRAFRGEYAWTHARTANAKLAVAVDADSVSAMGFAFDSLSARLTYASPGGHVDLTVLQDKNRQYAANGDYALFPDRRELRLENMKFRFDTAYWTMTRPSAVTWGGPGVRVIDLELKNRGDGRIYANGLLPTNGVADLRLDVDNFPVSNVADILQTDIDISGVATVHGMMTGTLSDPGFRGAFGIVYGTYNGTKVPITRGTFAYADRQLTSHLDLLRDDGRTMAVGDARIPINLAFTGVTGDRLLPDPMSVDVVADSLPVELIPQFTDIVSNVHGRAFGRLALRGTLRRPRLLGAFAVRDGTMMLNSIGTTFTDMHGSVRMLGDTVFVDSVYASAKGPGASARDARHRQLARAGIQSVSHVGRRGADQQRARQDSCRCGRRAHGAVQPRLSERRRDGHAGCDLRARADGPAPDRRRRSRVVPGARHRDHRGQEPVPSAIAAHGEYAHRDGNLGQAQHVGAQSRSERRGLYGRSDHGARGGRVGRAHRCDRDGSRRVQLPRQALSDQPRLGDVHRLARSQPHAPDHRRVSGADGVARRGQHSRADRRYAQTAEAIARERRAAAEDAVGAVDAPRVRSVDDVAPRLQFVERRGVRGEHGPLRRRRTVRGEATGVCRVGSDRRSGGDSSRPRFRHGCLQHHAG